MRNSDSRKNVNSDKKVINSYANSRSDKFSVLNFTNDVISQESKTNSINKFDLNEAIISAGDFNTYQIRILIYLSLVWILIPTIPVMLPYFRIIPNYYTLSNSDIYSEINFKNYSHLNYSLSQIDEKLLRKATYEEICNKSIPKIKSNDLVTWASDFDLICEKNYYFGIMGSCYFIGILIGNFFISHFNDKYGRKKVISFL